MTLCLSLSFSHNSCVLWVFFHQEVKSLPLAYSNSKAEFSLGQFRTCWSDSTKVNPRFCHALCVPILRLSFHSACVTDSGLVRTYKDKRDFLCLRCRPLPEIGKERKLNIYITFAPSQQISGGLIFPLGCSKFKTPLTCLSDPTPLVSIPLMNSDFLPDSQDL